MTVRKLTPSEKFFFFLIINTIFFGGVFALRILGLATEAILLILAAATSLEVIYVALSVQTAVTKNTQSMQEIEDCMKRVTEDEEKNQNALIYIGHQMKTIQHELDNLRKNPILRTNGNGHHPKANA